jgi:hypothetical protein
MNRNTMLHNHNDKASEKLPIVVDLIFNFGGHLLTEEELISLQASSHGHFRFLKDKVELHCVRVIDKTVTKVIDGIPFHFFKGKVGKLWLPFQMYRNIKQLNPDIIIVHGFSNPVQLLLLCLQSKVKIVIQYNGGGVPGGISGRLQKLTKYFIKDYMFTTLEQSAVFIKQKMISRKANIHEVLEGSTNKRCVSKIESKRMLNLVSTKTVFLWVGNLDANKDPLTVLIGLKDKLMHDPHLFLSIRN